MATIGNTYYNLADYFRSLAPGGDSIEADIVEILSELTPVVRDAVTIEAIARQTILAHQGEVSASSTVGAGTEVRFVLPVSGIPSEPTSEYAVVTGVSS